MKPWPIEKAKQLLALTNHKNTPCYVMDEATLKDRALRWLNPAKKLGKVSVHYAVKANDNLAILKRLDAWGCKFDIVSAGELYKLSSCGIDPLKVVFSGPGKTLEEMAFALDQGIGSFHLESPEELDSLIDLLQARGDDEKLVSVAIRVNLDMAGGGHAHISTGSDQHKFGVSVHQLAGMMQRIDQTKSISLAGLAAHVGSQLDDAQLYEAIAGQLVEIATSHGVLAQLQYLDIGGGAGIDADGENLIDPALILTKVHALIQAKAPHLSLKFEPGRSIAAAAGIILTRVTRVTSSKSYHFAVVDAGMNDYIRACLYGDSPQVINLTQAGQSPDKSSSPAAESKLYSISGPVCETSDTFSKTALSVQAGDVLALCNTGAYGQVMASNYNARVRLASYLLTESGEIHIIRKAEKFKSLIQWETDEALTLDQGWDQGLGQV